jgi:DNA-binding winged helix-turn-helix (wHTH) protein/tetratricopeptide (TPR) repeat protein
MRTSLHRGKMISKKSTRFEKPEDRKIERCFPGNLAFEQGGAKAGLGSLKVSIEPVKSACYAAPQSWGVPAMHTTENRAQTRGFGVFEVDERAAELRKRGVRIKLQEQPFQILCLLLDHSGEVVTREELRHKLWPEHTFVDFDRSLNKAMTKLRSALGDSAESPRYVETIPRHGYRFLAPVHQPHGETETAAAALVHPAYSGVQARVDEDRGSVPSFFGSLSLRTRLGRRRLIVLAATFALAILAAVVYLRIRASAGLIGASTSNSANLRQSVAVLGFKNLSGDSQEAWLSTALSDWLMTELAAGEHVRAIPAESVARMKMELALPDVDSLSRDSLMRIRKNLGTDYVVVGSYATLGSKSEGQVRLDLRLQDTRSGETIGAISEAGTEVHLLDLVSRAGEELRKKLGVRAVTREEAAEVAIALPSKGEAAKFYSEGLTKLRMFDTLAARDRLQKALQVEPDFALSHAALASVWEQLGYDERAKLEAKRAFELSSNLSRAERLLVEGRYRETMRDWEKAIEIHHALFDFFPDNLDYGLALANSEVKANRWKEALATIAALHSLPPPLGEDPRIDLAENDAARSLGDMKRAEAALAHAAEKAQAAGASLLLAKARREQAWLFENSGKQDKVEEAIREAKQLYIAANDRLGVAGTNTLEAIELERHGNYLEAKKRYEVAMEIYRETGSKLSLSNEYDNLGGIVFYLGDLAGARKRYEEALATYSEIGDQNGEALAKIGLGDVSLALGKHDQAKQLYMEALEICRRLGSRGRQGEALAGAGKVLRLERDPAEAEKYDTEAIAIYQEVGDNSEAAHVRLQLAQLLLDEGRSAEAAASARQSTKIFEAEKAGRYAAEAELSLSKALLAQGRIAEARKYVEQAITAARESHNRELELNSAIIAARLQAASGKLAEVGESISRLEMLIGESSAAGFAGIVYEARLAKGEIQMASSDRAAGRTNLETLAKDARTEGFYLIASQASAALRGARIPAALHTQN